MKRVHRRWTTIITVCIVVLATYSSPQSEASDWLTKGGTPLRQSVMPEMAGVMQVEEAWSQPAEVGPSATQPVVVGNTIYHLAGPYLWKIDLSETGEISSGPTALRNGSDPFAEKVNVYEVGYPLLSQSTPSYSSTSGMLYFGSAYGRLWAYDTRRAEFKSVDLGIGCPIVGSPLIMHAYGREFVVVADRPDYQGEEHDGRPACARSDGRVWLAWGFDGDEPPGRRTYQEDDFGGYITPSAVPASKDTGVEPTLLIGTDGFHGGRTAKMLITEDGLGGFRLKSMWQIQGGAGFAGNFVSDGTHGYWLDTNGHLWGAALDDRDKPPGWTSHSQDIPAMLGGEPAFTNTEPAVDVRPDGTHLYLTLRNYGPSPQSGEGGTGKAGAVVALGPGGQLKWLHRLGPEDSHPGASGTPAAPASLNTAPLAIPQSDALLFGDVNGYLYSYALTSANPWGGHRQPFFAQQGQDAPAGRISLLREGELPDRGQFVFSQVSGVGTDPAAGAGLILVGVNYVKNGVSGGRLVAYRLGQVYNLGWMEPPQPVELEVGKTTLVENQAAFQLFSRTGQPENTGTLLEACGAEPWIYWYIARSDGSAVRDLWPRVPVPGDVATGQGRSSAMGIEGQEGDPQEGYIVGVIDLPGVMALAGEYPTDPLIQEVVAAGRNLGHVPKLACQSEKRSEARQLPGWQAPLSGLTDNILKVPFTRKAPALHDCRIASLITPPSPLPSNQVDFVVGLNYQNSAGLSSTDGHLRVWARPGPNAEAPSAAWKPVTIPAGQQSLMLDGAFDHLPDGSWEIVADLQCEHDSDPSDNQMVVPLIVVEPGENDLPGYGSALTN